MLLEQLRIRLRAEYNALRSYLITANITAVQILDRAYEIVWKEEIVTLFEGMTDCRYTDDVIIWIMKEANALDFLYEIWMHTDYLLTAEFSDLLFDEISIRKDGASRNE